MEGQSMGVKSVWCQEPRHRYLERGGASWARTLGGAAWGACPPELEPGDFQGWGMGACPHRPVGVA